MAAFIVAALALSQLARAQFVAPPTNFTSKQGYANVTVRYKEVPPGVCEQDPNVLSYSGYADVSEDEHIFFWFFEARNVDPTTAPLTVWINGGPGSSSMIGLFQELGPCTVNASGVPVDNPYSWSNVSNMLFIDQPTQTGFSYSSPVPAYVDPDTNAIVTLPNNTCPEFAADWACGTYALPDITLTANSTPNAAPNVYLTLQGFMGAFPQYSSGDFFLTTESYGGHYGPIFSQYFLDQNALNASGTTPVNLKGVLIGNGWSDPLTAYESYFQYAVNNTYDITAYNATWEGLVYNNLYGAGNCYDQLVQCYTTGRDDVCATADTYCLNNVETPWDRATGRDEYDVRYLTPDPFPPTFYVDYLNSPAVQQAIGAYVNYTEASNTVGNAFGNTGDDARAFDIPSVLGNLVQENITVVLYYGDADYICNWLSGVSLLELIRPAPANFATAGFTPITSGSSNDTHPRGEVRQAANFAFARVYESGHEVPFYQPELALALFARVVAGRDVATGETPTALTRTQGPTESVYREGNATVTYDVVPRDAVYDWETGMAVLPAVNATGNATGPGRVAAGARRVAGLRGLEAERTAGEKRDRRSRLGLHHRAQGGKRLARPRR